MQPMPGAVQPLLPIITLVRGIRVCFSRSGCTPIIVQCAQSRGSKPPLYTASLKTLICIVISEFIVPFPGLSLIQKTWLILAIIVNQPYAPTSIGRGPADIYLDLIGTSSSSSSFLSKSSSMSSFSVTIEFLCKCSTSPPLNCHSISLLNAPSVFDASS